MDATINKDQISSAKTRILEQFMNTCENDDFTDKEVDFLCGAYGMAFRKQSRTELTSKAKNIDVNF